MKIGIRKYLPGIEKVVLFILSIIAVLTLHCRFEIYVGESPNLFLDFVNKLANTFIEGIDFLDILALIGIYWMLRFVAEKDKKTDKVTLILSVILSALLVACISYKKYNSTVLFLGNKYQAAISFMCLIGFAIIIYGLIRCFYYLLMGGRLQKKDKSFFLQKHFFWIGAVIIFLGWLPWIVLNYPGSGCPDSTAQLMQFLGDSDWNAGHPPLSTVIMGSTLVLGRMLVDANFGFFLYCLLQTCVGALVFSLSMKKLLDLGVPCKWCMTGILFFAITPLWGTYAQWVEKDLLYAEIAVLQTVCMVEIIVKKECNGKQTVLLAASSLLAVFLRNNGALAILPTLFILIFWLKKASRKKAAAVFGVVSAAYVGITYALYPALGMSGVGIVESMSVPLQQTARYVCEYPDEVTEKEKDVLEDIFYYNGLFSYDPVLSDTVRGMVRDMDLAEYMKVWFEMLWKHPGVYVSAFLNLNYGYLAPASQNIEAWVQRGYYDYMEEIGLHHVFSEEVSRPLAQLWHHGGYSPLIKYTATPGLYTWIIVILTMFLLRKRKYGALLLFVPSYLNIFACLASAMAGAIRYELPTVASVPLLIGWTFYVLHGGKEAFEKNSEKETALPEKGTNQ